MKVSLVTIVKNRIHQLRNLIAHLEQCEPLPDELIVVWMSPPSKDSLAGSNKFSIVHKFSCSEHLPIAKARNKGLNEAANPVMGYMSVDVLPAPDFIHCHSNRCSPGNLVVSEYYRGVDEETLYAGYHNFSVGPPDGEQQTPLNVSDYASLFFIHRDDFQRIGGFDERYDGFGINDEDFFTSCFHCGIKVDYAPSVTLHQHRANYACPLNHLVDFSRNAQIFYQKWGFYPNKKVLSEYVKCGCINADYELHGIQIKRLPTPAEIDQASQYA